MYRWNGGREINENYNDYKVNVSESGEQVWVWSASRVFAQLQIGYYLLFESEFENQTIRLLGSRK